MAIHSFKRSLRTWGVVGLLAVMVLAGCGTKPAGSDPAPGGTQQPGQTDTKPGEPKEGGTLTFVFGSPVLSTDPGLSGGTHEQTVRRLIYETLVILNEKSEIEPLLAESWEPSDDNLTWTFNLRKDVKFHDGTPFNAEAVKKSLDRLLDPENSLPRRSNVTAVESVSVVDEFVVAIKTKEPFGPLLNHLALDSTSIISPAALDQHGKEIGWNPVGTGAFKYESHVAEQSVTLAKNADYWGEKAYLDKIVIKSVAEDSTRLTMLEAGEADVIVNVPGFEVERLKSSKDVSVRIDPSTRVSHLGINTTKAPFDNPKVRQALNHAVDRQTLVNGILRNIGMEAKSIVAPHTWGYDDSFGYAFDPEKAKSLLAEAGYPNGFKATLWTPQGRYYMDKETSVAVQAQLKAVGVDVEIQTIDWATYLKVLRDPQETNTAELYLLGWESGSADIGYVMDMIFHSSQLPPSGWNTMFYVSEEADALIDQGRAELDPEKRKQIFSDLQKRVMEDAPWVPLYVYENVSGVRNNVHGMKVLATENFILKGVWKD